MLALRPSLVLLPVLLLATPAAAGPSFWTKSALAEAPTYFPGGTTTMVVAAGANARAAAGTLREALQASEHLDVVTDGRALGNVDELADAQIVQRAFAQRICDRVAVVRVFRAGDSLKAVVTIYGASGDVTSAFTFAPGKPLAANPSPDKAEDGVSRDQLQTVSRTTGNGARTPGGDSGQRAQGGASAEDTSDVDAETGEVTYKTNAMLGYTAQGIMAMEHVTFFKNGRAITDTAEFYDAVEQPNQARAHRDQVKAHESAVRRGGLLGLAGTLGIIGFGTWWLVEGVQSDRVDYNTGEVIETHDATLPMLLTGASVVAIVAGYYLAKGSPAPKELTGDEGIVMAKQYNKKRRQTNDAQATKLRFSPSVTASGGGFVLGGTF
jgi:hypothetical protein